MKEKTVLMDAAAMDRALTRIAHEMLERNHGAQDLVILGIQRRGVPLGRLLQEKIRKFEGVDVPMGVLDITFYRDDLSLLNEHPVINGTDVPFALEEKTVVMVDDVLYTGRTARAALDAIMDLGRAQSVQLAVLIDRGHRELPIRADYVGKNVPTSKNEVVGVMVEEFDGENTVKLFDLD
ncbi:MAG: bifunctional pyr operon transcriptional regulator/uracil phosphoribosyltransferase PyrR [Eubacteriales bacterium]|nr:bifunctional pyr operon transcriptional regulator/uracil phosphoribosyltransferase PyrR [Eubacteriales bacterium]